MHLVIPFPGLWEEFSTQKALWWAATDHCGQEASFSSSKSALRDQRAIRFSGWGSLPPDPVPCLLYPSCSSLVLSFGGVLMLCVAAKTSPFLTRGTEFLPLRSLCGYLCCWWCSWENMTVCSQPQGSVLCVLCSIHWWWRALSLPLFVGPWLPWNQPAEIYLWPLLDWAGRGADGTYSLSPKTKADLWGSASLFQAQKGSICVYG